MFYINEVNDAQLIKKKFVEKCFMKHRCGLIGNKFNFDLNYKKYISEDIVEKYLFSLIKNNHEKLYELIIEENTLKLVKENKNLIKCKISDVSEHVNVKYNFPGWKIMVNKKLVAEYTDSISFDRLNLSIGFEGIGYGDIRINDLTLSSN